jgi:hypothetical protein
MSKKAKHILSDNPFVKELTTKWMLKNSLEPDAEITRSLAHDSLDHSGVGDHRVGIVGLEGDTASALKTPEVEGLLSNQLPTDREMIENLLNSRSWKMTAPLRALKRPLFGLVKGVEIC